VLNSVLRVQLLQDPPPLVFWIDFGSKGAAVISTRRRLGSAWFRFMPPTQGSALQHALSNLSTSFFSAFYALDRNDGLGPVGAATILALIIHSSLFVLGFHCALP
jgi:hypothetical protein